MYIHTAMSTPPTHLSSLTDHLPYSIPTLPPLTGLPTRSCEFLTELDFSRHYRYRRWRQRGTRQNSVSQHISADTMTLSVQMITACRKYIIDTRSALTAVRVGRYWHCARTVSAIAFIHPFISRAGGQNGSRKDVDDSPSTGFIIQRALIHRRCRQLFMRLPQRRFFQFYEGREAEAYARRQMRVSCPSIRRRHMARKKCYASWTVRHRNVSSPSPSISTPTSEIKRTARDRNASGQ